MSFALFSTNLGLAFGLTMDSLLNTVWFIMDSICTVTVAREKFRGVDMSCMTTYSEGRRNAPVCDYLVESQSTVLLAPPSG